jgi:hypothetical protein
VKHAALMIAFACAINSVAVAGSEGAATSVPDLSFRDFYKMPVGPRGLEASPTLVDLDGKTVRMRGYMVHQDVPLPGVFILSPLPVELGDADESLSDDLPPNVVFVHFDAEPLPYVRGEIEVVGQLDVGAQNEADGHVSQARLTLDAAQLAAVTKWVSTTTGEAKAPTGHSS